MEKINRTDEERAAIARGWRSSGLPQAAYAARFEVSGRTLRFGARRWAPPAGAADDVAAKIIEEAVDKLLVVLGTVRPTLALGSSGRCTEADLPVPMPGP